MHADILIYAGFDELDALAPFEVLKGLAEAEPEAHSVALVTLDGGGPVTASHGTVLHPHAALSERPDVLIVPGGGWRARDGSAGTWRAAQEGTLPAAIAARHARGSVVASVCTGAMLLSAAGLLAGRPATTHHIALAELAQQGARIVDGARVVDDGELLTAGGVTSGLDLALWLIERFAGPAAACRVEHSLEYERRGTVWRAENRIREPVPSPRPPRAGGTSLGCGTGTA